MANRLTDMLCIAPGIILPYAGSVAPNASTGWLPCDGAAVSRTTYAALFAAIGTSFGAGNGSTTFNVPDLQGRAPIGVGTGSGLSARTLGEKAGAETHQLTIAQMPTHGHPFRASYTNQASPATNNTGGFMTTTTGDAAQNSHTGGASASQGQQIGGEGGGTAHNNMQPFTALRYLIKW